MHKFTLICTCAAKLRSMQVLFLLFQFLWLGERVGLAQQGQITVGPNVQVSKARAEMTHNEVLLSADPLNPNRLMGCTMAFSPKLNKVVTLVYVSSDGGKNWDLRLPMTGESIAEILLVPLAWMALRISRPLNGWNPEARGCSFIDLKTAARRGLHRRS